MQYANSYFVDPIEKSRDTFGFSQEDWWDQLQKLDSSVHSPNELIEENSWEYKAVKGLAGKGLLTGEIDASFYIEKPITRYKLAGAVSEMLNNYVSLVKNGYFTPSTLSKNYLADNEKIYTEDVKSRVRKPHEIKRDEIEFKPQIPTYPKKVQEKEENKTLKKIEGGGTLKNALPEQFPLSPTEDKGGLLQRSGMKLLDVPKPPEKEFVEKKEFEEKVEDIKKAVDLKAKDIEALQKLVDEFKKELKDINKKFKQDLNSVKKLVLKNKGDIEKLKDDIIRFKVEGTGEVNYVTMKKAEEFGRVGLVSKLSLKIKSQPRKLDNLIMSAETSALAVHGGRTGFLGYTEGTNTAFSLDSFYISYQEPSTRKVIRPFRLRAFDAGNVSIAASPLTVFGRKLQGGTATFLTQNMTLNLFGGRTSLHPWLKTGREIGREWYQDIDYIEDKRELVSEGQLFNKIDTPYDSYLYGGSLQFTLLGEEKSLAYLSKIYSFQDRELSPFEESYCQGRNSYGKWINLDVPYIDTGTNELKYWDLVCVPPEVNRVESLWIRYPLNQRKNLFLTLDYAISNYRKQGFILRYDENVTDSDVKPSEKYNKWDLIPDRSGKDQGFIALLDYSKGDIKLFPVGIIRFDNKFASKNLGFFGLDINDLLGGIGGISFLPISIQSLELYVANLSITKLDDNYTFSTYYITGGEYTPMYFDPSAVAFMSGSATTMGIPILKFIQGINNRDARLDLTYVKNSFNYYITDDINLKINYDFADVKLIGCVDSNEAAIKDDKGNTIDKRLGDGVKQCVGGGADDMGLGIGIKYKTQKYGLGWKASKYADYELNYETTDMIGNVNIQFAGLEGLDRAIAQYLKFGRSYKITNRLKYQLMETTFFDFKLVNEYDRFPPYGDVEETYTDDIKRDKYFFGTSLQTTF